MWKRKLEAKRLIFCGSGSTLMKQVGSGSELGSESVEKELETEAVFFKIRRFRIFKLATTVGVKNVTIIILFLGTNQCMLNFHFSYCHNFLKLSQLIKSHEHTVFVRDHGCDIRDIPPILQWHQSSRVYCGQQWPRCGYGRLLLNLLWLLHVLASGTAK